MFSPEIKGLERIRKVKKTHVDSPYYIVFEHCKVAPDPRHEETNWQPQNTRETKNSKRDFFIHLWPYEMSWCCSWSSWSPMSKPANCHPESHAQSEYLGRFQIIEISAHNNEYIKHFKNCSRDLACLALDYSHQRGTGISRAQLMDLFSQIC